FSAIRGEGAIYNGKKMQIGSAQTLHESLLATGFFADNEPCLKEQLQIFSTLIRECRGIRRAGAAAYDLCMVAKGVFDCFWERNLNPWDTAAGVLLVEEAGGVSKTYRGQRYHPFHNSLIAGNPAVLDQVLKVIQQNISTDAH
ncbi:MAG: inositol monophosphatase, partial [Pseudobdellovibrionaceae bacterium]